MHNPRGRGDHAEVTQALLSPSQQLIPLQISLKLEIHILLQRITGAKVVNLHRVIDHQVTLNQRVDLFGVATHANHGIPQSGHVDHCGNPREILQNHTAHHKRDLNLLWFGGVPVRHLRDMLFVHQETVHISETGFQQNSHRKWQRINLSKALHGQLGKRIILQFATAGLENRLGPKWIRHRHI